MADRGIDLARHRSRHARCRDARGRRPHHRHGRASTCARSRCSPTRPPRTFTLPELVRRAEAVGPWPGAACRSLASSVGAGASAEDLRRTPSRPTTWPTRGRSRARSDAAPRDYDAPADAWSTTSCADRGSATLRSPDATPEGAACGSPSEPTTRASSSRATWSPCCTALGHDGARPRHRRHRVGRLPAYLRRRRPRRGARRRRAWHRARRLAARASRSPPTRWHGVRAALCNDLYTARMAPRAQRRQRAVDGRAHRGPRPGRRDRGLLPADALPLTTGR